MKAIPHTASDTSARFWRACGFVVVLLVLLLQPSPAITQEAPTPAVTCPGSRVSRLSVGIEARVNAELGINFRSRPTAAAERLAIIPDQTIVDVLEGPYCSGDFAWWRIAYNGMEGWTAESFEMRYLLEPFVPFPVDLAQIAFEVPPELTENVIYNPDAVPAIVVLEDYPVRAGLTPVQIRLIELDDAETLSEELQTARRLIDVGDPAMATASLHNDGITAGRVRFIDFPGGRALRYITVALDPTDSNPTPRLMYRLHAATDAVMISAELPLSTRDLPLSFTLPEVTATLTPDPEATEEPPLHPVIQEAVSVYLTQTNVMLANIRAEAYTPSLIVLDEIAQSMIAEDAEAPAPILSFQYGSSLAFDFSPRIASSITAEVVPPAPNGIPQHVMAFFDSYPIGNYRQAPAVRLYRTDEFALITESIDRLETLLEERPTPPGAGDIPALVDIPGQTRVFIARPRYVNFANGGGIRFITQYTTSKAFVANESIFYYFIGLTDDGEFLVTARFPVNAPNIPAVYNPDAPDFPTEQFENDYPAYLQEAVSRLGEPGETEFTPSIGTLDAVIESLEVMPDD